MTIDEKIELGLGDDPLIENPIPRTVVPSEFHNTPLSYFYPVFAPMLANIYHAVTGDSVTGMLPSFEDGQRVQNILYSIHQSSLQGRKIPLYYS